MNGVENINSVFDEKINDDVSRFAALLGIYLQNIKIPNSFYVHTYFQGVLANRRRTNLSSTKKEC